MRNALIITPILFAAMQSAAVGQSLSPMSESYVSYAGKVFFKLTVSNPYETPQKFEVAVLDSARKEIPGSRVLPTRIRLASGGARAVSITAPLKPEGATVFIVCVRSGEFRGNSGNIRGEVCGKYRATKRTF